MLSSDPPELERTGSMMQNRVIREPITTIVSNKFFDLFSMNIIKNVKIIANAIAITASIIYVYLFIIY